MTNAMGGPTKKGPTAKAHRIKTLKTCIQIIQECDKSKRRPIKKTHRALLESLKKEGHHLMPLYLPNIVTRRDPNLMFGGEVLWEAFYDNWEPLDPVGLGGTEEEAIWDLQRQTDGEDL